MYNSERSTQEGMSGEDVLVEKVYPQETWAQFEDKHNIDCTSLHLGFLITVLGRCMTMMGLLQHLHF